MPSAPSGAEGIGPQAPYAGPGPAPWGLAWGRGRGGAGGEGDGGGSGGGMGGGPGPGPWPLFIWGYLFIWGSPISLYMGVPFVGLIPLGWASSILQALFSRWSLLGHYRLLSHSRWSSCNLDAQPVPVGIMSIQ